MDMSGRKNGDYDCIGLGWNLGAIIRGRWLEAGEQRDGMGGREAGRQEADRNGI